MFVRLTIIKQGVHDVQPVVIGALEITVEKIESIERKTEANYSKVLMDSGEFYYIEETPGQIINKIEEAETMNYS